MAIIRWSLIQQLQLEHEKQLEQIHAHYLTYHDISRGIIEDLTMQRQRWTERKNNLFKTESYHHIIFISQQ